MVTVFRHGSDGFTGRIWSAFGERQSCTLDACLVPVTPPGSQDSSSCQDDGLSLPLYFRNRDARTSARELGMSH